MVLNPIAVVHAQGGFEYTLSNSGDVSLSPGNSVSTTIIATLTAGTASNVTLSCDLTNIPPNASGTKCAFTPTVVAPTDKGKASVLTITADGNGRESSADSSDNFHGHGRCEDRCEPDSKGEPELHCKFLDNCGSERH